MDPVRYEDMIPGCYDPSARLKDMDVDGVEAALCFPSFPGFGGGVFQRAQDKDLALLCVRAWNDFYIDEWCATDRSRFVPLSIVPTWDPQLAAAEVRRTAAMGSRTISSRTVRYRWDCRPSTTPTGTLFGMRVKKPALSSHSTSVLVVSFPGSRFRGPKR